MQAMPVFLAIRFAVVKLINHREPPEHILHHDHRTIDDDAEIHCPQRQQVGGNADKREADKR